MKKLILIISILIMASNTVYAEDDLPSCGTNCTYTIENNVLTIKPIDQTKPAKVKSYTRNCNPDCWGTNAPWYSQGVTKVEIKEGITDIGSHAFEDIPSITYVDLPTGLKTIGANAFNQAGIKTLTIPDSVTDIGEWAFSSNKSLTILVLGENLQNVGANAFANAQSLKSVVIPDSVVNLSSTTFGGISSYTMLLDEIYCSNTQTAQCDAAVAYMNLASKTYEKYGDGYLFDGKFYAKFSDIGTPNHVKKRIYTTDEASRISGKKNSVSIRYK